MLSRRYVLLSPGIGKLLRSRVRLLVRAERSAYTCVLLRSRHASKRSVNVGQESYEVLSTRHHLPSRQHSFMWSLVPKIPRLADSVPCGHYTTVQLLSQTLLYNTYLCLNIRKLLSFSAWVPPPLPPPPSTSPLGSAPMINCYCCCCCCCAVNTGPSPDTS